MSSQSKQYSGHVRAFSKLLIRLRSALGNDLDKVTILAIIAERHYAAIEAAEDQAQPGQSFATARGRCAINAHSVALYAGIPRETARRKIAALVEKGWVSCDPSGALSPTARSAQDLEDGTAATLNYIRSISEDHQS